MCVCRDGPLEGWSKLDILISTPGRLIDHINGTRGFNLQHLRYLVVDEADRLLDLQSGHEWVSSLLEALKPSSPTASTMLGPSNVVYDKYLEGEFYPPPRNQAITSGKRQKSCYFQPLLLGILKTCQCWN